MVSGAKKCNSPAEHGLPSRPEQPAAGPADCKPSKRSSSDSQPTKKDHVHNKTSALLAACVVGEEAQPEIGVTPDERRVWGAEVKRMQEECRKRTEQLAKPQERPTGLQTTVLPRVMWGTQDMLTPVSPQALKGKASPRTQELAKPKRINRRGAEDDN